MSHIVQSAEVDGYTWRCKSCSKKAALRQASFFSNQKLTLRHYISVLYLFCNDVSGNSAVKMLCPGDMERKSVYTWYNLYRDLMSRELVENPVQLGGPGEIVEVDESKWSKAHKHHRGDNPGRDGPWVFGLIQRSNSKVAVFIVDRRTREELIPHIQNIVLPGTTIHTDDWRAYRILSTLGYQHRVVVHKDNFVDPLTGVHTQTIEGFWGNSKSPFKSMRGVVQDQLPAHLDEVVFRWNKKGQDLFQMMLTLMAQHYNPRDDGIPAEAGQAPAIVYK